MVRPLKAVAGEEVGFFLRSFCCSNPTLDLFGLRCDHVLPFFCYLHSHKAPNSLCHEQSPVPRPSETCGSNTMVGVRRPVVQLLWMFVPVEHCDLWPFILSSLPVNQCIMSSTVNFREKKKLLPIWLDPNCAKKKKKDGRFSIQRWILSLLQLKKKKSTLYVGLCFSFGWECNKDSTRFPIENSKRLEAKVSGAKLLEKSWKFGLAQIKSPHQWHRWEILVAIYYFKPFIEYKGVQECVYS